jgi:hypothetical protein
VSPASLRHGSTSGTGPPPRGEERHLCSGRNRRVTPRGSAVRPRRGAGVPRGHRAPAVTESADDAQRRGLPTTGAACPDRRRAGLGRAAEGAGPARPGPLPVGRSGVVVAGAHTCPRASPGRPGMPSLRSATRLPDVRPRRRRALRHLGRHVAGRTASIASRRPMTQGGPPAVRPQALPCPWAGIAECGRGCRRSHATLSSPRGERYPGRRMVDRRPTERLPAGRPVRGDGGEVALLVGGAQDPQRDIGGPGGLGPRAGKRRPDDVSRRGGRRRRRSPRSSPGARPW